MFTSMRRLVAVLAAALGIVVAAEPVLAQSESGLEEVVVTARKREESSLNAPASIDVFNQQTIEAAGIQSPADFIALVPNMQLVQTQNAGTSFVVLRGISQARNSEPSVAVLVDGVLETNPAEFNRELYDLKQIEVLKGPQGALYGRNAIAGAIIIQTADMSDHLEVRSKLGYGNGNSILAQVAVGDAMNDAKTLKYRASFSYTDTDGFLENVYLHQKADPARDYSGRLRFLWNASDAVTADLRLSADRLETRAFYFVIPRADESNPFSTFTTPPDANNTSSPIQVNNTGEDNRDLRDAALKLDFKTGGGTITSISAYDYTKEIATGDAYDFRPRLNSIFYALYGTDFNQSQYLTVKSYSQELRFTANPLGNFTWNAGAYYIHTDRFISTGNMADTGAGVFPVYEEPRIGGDNPSTTFLADSQKQDAWALFGDATYEFTRQWELDAALRYDEDTRKNTTDTPTEWLPVDPQGGHYGAYQGLERKNTWDKLQPKGTLRYKPADNLTFYGGWSRGFRSGGFNQTGVGAAAENSVPRIYGVHDEFQAETADTWEVGFKGDFMDRRLSVTAALFDTKSTNGYFFVFIASNSTQNLGNLDATYKGGEIAINLRPIDNLLLYAAYGYTDSHIDHMEDPSVVGNQAPLVTRDTVNAGAQYTQPLGNGMSIVGRVDYQGLGRTWWDPYNVTSRDPVNLIDARLGLQGANWNVTAWSKNLTDQKYNAEFSPGGFLWRALPRQYGVEVGYKF
ncbi:MAG: TonB-dependent receptor [Proteobacteria bacterium]|nr:TonB-dependent receptor [Pseudomonadota bacterium]